MRRPDTTTVSPGRAAEDRVAERQIQRYVCRPQPREFNNPANPLAGSDRSSEAACFGDRRAWSVCPDQSTRTEPIP